MRGIYWRPEAWDSYVELQPQKQIIKRVNTLIKDIQRNGYNCSYGRPEKLRNIFSGLASVRIDKKNRLVFRVEDSQVDIFECGGHYGDR